MSEDEVHQVELTEDELVFIRSVLDEKVSSSDIQEQDSALEALESLPEPKSASWRL